MVFCVVVCNDKVQCGMMQYSVEYYDVMWCIVLCYGVVCDQDIDEGRYGMVLRGVYVCDFAK